MEKPGLQETIFERGAVEGREARRQVGRLGIHAGEKR